MFDSDFTVEDGVLVAYNGSFGAVTIPAGVTRIGDSVFAFADRLTSVTIPSSVISIGDYVFTACEGLGSVSDIYYGGSAGQWASLTAGAEVPAAAAIHFNSPGN